jgi:gliding motility-associated-like protein
MEFIQNKGQWDNKINYRSDFRAGSFFLENKGFTVLLHNPADIQKISEYTHGHGIKNPKEPLPNNIVLHSFAYNVTFLGATENPERIPDKALATYNNYFVGNDEKKWATDCKIFTAVTYKNVYPNIDVRYYSNGDKLKYDFIVKPGGNPNIISMRFDGGVALSIKNKELIIGTSLGDVKELAPYTYQTNTAGKKDVNTKFIIKDNVVNFSVNEYDRNSTLIIDPQLIFSSFTGSTQDNWGYTATPGPDGSFYAGGVVFGAGYPVSPGAFQTVYLGGNPEGSFSGIDMGIIKFSPDGGARIYATYIGGSGNEQPHSMIVDAAGNLVIAGRSNSVNYPLRSGVPATGTNYDIVITKLNSTGTALIGSIKIGGAADDGVNIRPKYISPLGVDRLRRNYGDDARSEVILDASNNVYLASCTQSSNFPLLSPVQGVFGGVQDGVILKFTPTLSGLLFSTYFGGSAEDACFVAAINPVTGNLYVGGATASNNLLGSTTGTISAGNNGGIDGFITMLPPTGASIIKTTYLGTGNTDLVYGLKFDKLGFPYAMGTTTGAWPIINATYFVTGAKQFIAKMQPDLSAYIYSTSFGTPVSDPNISPIAFLVDRCENVYVSGWGGGLNVTQGYSTGNTNGLPEVNPLAGIPGADGADFYFFVLRKDAQSQLFGSHFGQFGGLGDHVDGGTSRFDANGIIYQAMCANCGGRSSNPPVFFPTTPGVWAQTNGSNSCNEAAVKIDMNFAGIGAEIQSEIDGEINDTLGCIPLVVNFKDLRQKGVTYYWNFNSAAPGNINNVDATTTTPNVTFTFATVGVFRVRLIAEDLSTCNLRDTSYITIRTGRDRVTPKFVRRKIGPCTSTTYELTNTTSSVGGSAYLPRTFVWDYGDGSPLDTTDFAPPRLHTYPGPGSYIIKLICLDMRFCNAPDSTKDTLRINENVKAIPSSPALGCAPYTAFFKNNSLGGLSWKWEFGDPGSGALNTSTDFEPTHLYQNVGTYQFRLIAFDSTTCNKTDTSAFFTIKVVQKPQANFTWAPNPPEANVPVRFTNLSSFADSYLWNFGDGESSTLFEPIHEYNATKTYNAELIAYSIAGCTDTFRLPVNVIVNPLLDVPNAFTPGRFGINSEINVRGFGIEDMDWRIYNRWGQLIFRSSNKKQGWDGSYKGKIQPLDVYSYTLDVIFSDGAKMRKTGDITLLR